MYTMLWSTIAITVCLSVTTVGTTSAAASGPNIVLVMADDQGWGETGYYNHPVLRTPNLDGMATAGLRFDRYYAAAPVCSPTRASVLTGRSNNRTGVESHGYALRLQEKTLAQALQQAGYRTGHFGKWHLNGMRGPGVPLLASDTHTPTAFGFDQWLSVSNFFDRNPLLSRQGKFEDYQGDSSEIVVEQALEFIAAGVHEGKPTFTVIWYGTPHSPFVASDEDRSAFAELDSDSQHHYGELVAMDRSLGALRAGLRKLNIGDETLVWFTSDNGGLPRIAPSTAGGLRDFKGSLYEGGLRVPAVIEWPAGIAKPRATQFPACAIDIFSTLADIVGLPPNTMLPQDGISLKPLLDNRDGVDGRRVKPIPFNYAGQTAVIDNQYKLLHVRAGKNDQADLRYELYDLDADLAESKNLLEELPEVAQRMQQHMAAWQAELADSVAGLDYPERKVAETHPQPRSWTAVPEYEPYFEEWSKRPEYRAAIKKRQ
ncbi:MAG: sulfatase-like hydrolase/transferase [Pirellulaceae bacterium]